jgi:hypothetical protein
MQSSGSEQRKLALDVGVVAKWNAACATAQINTIIIALQILPNYIYLQSYAFNCHSGIKTLPQHEARNASLAQRVQLVTKNKSNEDIRAVASRRLFFILCESAQY